MANLISVSEAAQRLGLSEKTLYRFIDRGEFVPAVYQFPTGTLRIDAHDLNEWINALRINPPTVETQQ